MLSINKLLTSEFFDVYEQIFSRVQFIQKSDRSIDEKKNLMRTLRQEYDDRATSYNKVAVTFANEFMTRYKLTDYPIEARIGSPTPYGNQPKGYLWSGISIDKEKSYSFQYSWVFTHEHLEVTFCFGSGSSSSGRVEEIKKNERENGMREMEKRFIQITSSLANRAIIDKLLNEEHFNLTAEWLNSKIQKIENLDEYIARLKDKNGAKSGITRFFKKQELLAHDFNLEQLICRYFEIFRPIWDHLHGAYIESELDYRQPIGIKEQLKKIKIFIRQKGFTYPDHLIETFYLSIKAKPFVILAGISGTGKTRLVRLFAEAMGAMEDNKQFTLVPVRPDWSDPSDLIGFQNLNQKFIPGKLTEVIVEASKEENRSKPYFICLDEMNLARVEHYFSDVLSILETQKRQDDRIITDTIVSIGDDKYSIPDNLFIIGTVNMDETTHPFSKKVLDRANTIEFNYIELMNFPEQTLTEDSTGTALPASFLRSDYLVLKDAYADHSDLIKRTTEKLVIINSILEGTHSHIGFRVRDTVCFFLIYNERFGNLMSETDAFDVQMMQKILPRIQGSNQSVKMVIIQLLRFCQGELPKLVDDSLLNDASQLYEPYAKSSGPAGVIYPQSAKKLAYMLRRMDEDGFTSFWLS